MSKSEAKPFVVDDMIAAAITGTEWIGTVCGDAVNGQHTISFKRGEQDHEVALNVSRLDPKAADARKNWIAATRAALAAIPAAESEVAS
jgi:hypothetical protein